MRSKDRDGQDHQPCKRKLTGGEADGVDAFEFYLGDDRGDGVAEACQCDKEDTAEELGVGYVLLSALAVTEDDDDDSGESEQNSPDGESIGTCALHGQREQERPDGGCGIENSGDAARDSSFAESKQSKRESVIEERDNGQRWPELFLRKGA